MSKHILVEYRENEREIALTDGGKLLFHALDAGGAVRTEQIYLGRVDRIMKGMEAAFVTLGGELFGFLPFSECEERPVSGQLMPVQVKKPPIGEKRCYLTRRLSLAGRAVILTPCSDRCAVSQKITDEKERARLNTLARAICPPRMGLVMRTESAGAGRETLKAEVHELLLKWQGVSARLAAGKVGLIDGGDDTLARLLRDEHGMIEALLTNRPEALPALSLPVRYAQSPFALENIHAKLRKSWQRKVWLDCGGFLVIDRTEALTVIDVNSGKYAGVKSGTESSFLSLNREAAREVARLMRLRNMGGIVLVDFVDMETDEARAAVTEELEKAFMDDPVKCVVHGFTSLGIMEMTRKKTMDSLSPLPLCIRCGGTGLEEAGMDAE